MSIDHAWAKLNDAYGDPQKGTYRWTPEERRKILDRGTEYKDDFDTPTGNTTLAPQDVPQHPEARPHTIFQDTSADLRPQKLKTTSTQTKHAYTHPKRPRHQFKYRVTTKQDTRARSQGKDGHQGRNQP